MTRNGSWARSSLSSHLSFGRMRDSSNEDAFHSGWSSAVEQIQAWLTTIKQIPCLKGHWAIIRFPDVDPPTWKRRGWGKYQISLMQILMCAWAIEALDVFESFTKMTSQDGYNYMYVGEVQVRDSCHDNWVLRNHPLPVCCSPSQDLVH